MAADVKAGFEEVVAPNPPIEAVVVGVTELKVAVGCLAYGLVLPPVGEYRAFD